jgi:hypothetical protein
MDELYLQYPEVIASMKTATFTSHDFILELARLHQRAYINALFAARDSDAPFRQVHAQLAQRLHQHPKLIRFLSHGNSLDIFDKAVQCANWERL